MRPPPASSRRGGPVAERRRSIHPTQVTGVVFMTAIAVGIALRAWYVFHQPVSSDVAIVGLMASQILHGHFSAFYWGQAYGGAEPYLVAPIFTIFGASAWTLDAVPILLSAGAAILTWRIARRLVSDPALAVLAGATVWVVPQAAVWNSTMEYGFRGVTLFCGLGALLLSLRVLDGRRGWLEFAGLGLLVGVGWWSSPEIVYFVVPAATVVVIAIVEDEEIGRLARWGGRCVLTALAAIVGELPWLWVNINSHFRSLSTGAFMVPPGAPGYTGRVRIFFEFMVPMLFGLRSEETGRWVWGRPLSIVVLAALLLLVVVALLMCLLQDSRSRAIALAVLVFPFLLAFSPATWAWEDGRYSDLGFPLIILVLVIGSAEAVRRWHRGARSVQRHTTSRSRVVLSMIAAVLLALSVVNFATFQSYVDSSSFFSGWTNPNAPTQQAIHDLEADGVRDGYADYWVAYRLDFLSD